MANVLNYDDFLKVWYSDTVIKFRNKSLNSVKNGCRLCTVFPEINI